ncbi:MAG TPA: hypothetical protein P5186_07620 [Candidatus Paceibacterota bacterium]|nr:hypothetical protein [Verrucomicrobiota bacterium]HRY47898.1 hypothetical protein [Candidatus Paceibacterota bacterium]HSA03761.1 hypothetical protein [Candidatus Paceibacterota bacterium]
MQLSVVEELIYKFLQNFPRRFFSPEEVSGILGDDRLKKTDAEWSLAAMKHLASLDFIEMTATGHFRYLGAGETDRIRRNRNKPMRKVAACPTIGNILSAQGIHYDGKTIEIQDTQETLQQALEALKKRVAARQSHRPVKP